MFGRSKKTSNADTKTFQIEGMHCTSCAMNIDGELEEIPGVIEATTSYARSETRVTYDATQVTKEQIEKAIEATGYSVARG